MKVSYVKVQIERIYNIHGRSVLATSQSDSPALNKLGPHLAAVHAHVTVVGPRRRAQVTRVKGKSKI